MPRKKKPSPGQTSLFDVAVDVVEAQPDDGRPEPDRDEAGRFKPKDTLSTARASVFAKWLEGSYCPCCTQRVQLYRVPLDSAMSHALLALRRHDDARRSGRTYPPTMYREGGFFHIERVFKATPRLIASARGSAVKLRHWGLIEGRRAGAVDEASGEAVPVGFYRITDLGREFADGVLALPKYVFQFNDAIIDPVEAGVPADLYEGQTSTLRDALGVRFDFDTVVHGLAGVVPLSGSDPQAAADAARRN